MAKGAPMVIGFCQQKPRSWRSARISLEISLQLRCQRSKEKKSMAFLHEKRGEVRRRPCEEPLVGAPTLWPIPEASSALICCTLFLGVLGLGFGLLGFRIYLIGSDFIGLLLYCFFIFAF
ncbi:hypothetical protein ERO13_A13G126200v2 [Gossypium hirsutum]|uniref:Uncharacterized protein n=2 Tax=Gossypium TaxID=3633 RepID=A0A5D2WHK5_GOSMU|nr:hypothetical protein ERO13_A13G126200v2 [Gossypium hirsutum]TYG86647.1 hypothetical protein ES288_A13G150400v1 [Gossypium darwinii]TYJ01335.1 hypothetical protein E1A91_A13G146500v1 [Gossypium mustelinum]